MVIMLGVSLIETISFALTSALRSTPIRASGCLSNVPTDYPNGVKLCDFVPLNFYERCKGETCMNEEHMCSNEEYASLCFKQRIPALTIYVMHSAPDKEQDECQALRMIFNKIPTRFFQLTWKHFFPEQSHVTRMSGSTLAGLWSVLDLDLTSNKNKKSTIVNGRKDKATLFIRAGAKTLSYIATDCNGQVLGEGWLPGLSEHALMLDESLTSGEDGDAVSALLDSQIPVFSNDGNHAVRSGVCQLLNGFLYSLILSWKVQCGEPPKDRLYVYVDGFFHTMVLSLLQGTLKGFQGANKKNGCRVSELLVQDGKHVKGNKDHYSSNYGLGRVVYMAKEKHLERHVVSLALVGQRVLRASSQEYGTITSAVKRSGREYPFDLTYQILYDNGESDEQKLEDAIGTLCCCDSSDFHMRSHSVLTANLLV